MPNWIQSMKMEVYSITKASKDLSEISNAQDGFT